MTRGVGGQSPANVTHNLRGIDFPAKKADLVQHAKQNGAEPDVLDAIQAMPDRSYETMADVMQAYGEAEPAQPRR